jgi:hypothetical protein
MLKIKYSFHLPKLEGDGGGGREGDDGGGREGDDGGDQISVAGEAVRRSRSGLEEETGPVGGRVAGGRRTGGRESEGESCSEKEKNKF